MYARGAPETVLWLCRPRDNMLRQEMDLLGRTARGSVMVLLIILREYLAIFSIKPENIDDNFTCPSQHPHISYARSMFIQQKPIFCLPLPPTHGWRHLPKLDKQILCLVAAASGGPKDVKADAHLPPSMCPRQRCYPWVTGKNEWGQWVCQASPSHQSHDQSNKIDFNF